MLWIIFRLVIIAFGVTIAAYVVPGIEVDSMTTAFKAALILGVLNVFIKPVLMILTLPITLITLGLFALVINGLMLWLVGSVVTGLEITGFLPAFVGAVVISIISVTFNSAFWE